MSVRETADAAAPTLALPRKRERGLTDFGAETEDTTNPSVRRTAPPLPLFAGEGWGGGLAAWYGPDRLPTD